MSIEKKDLAFIYADVSVSRMELDHGRIPREVYFQNAVRAMTSELIRHREVFSEHTSQDRKTDVVTTRYGLTLLADSRRLSDIDDVIKGARMGGMTDALELVERAAGAHWSFGVDPDFALRCAADDIKRAIVKESEK